MSRFRLLLNNPRKFLRLVRERVNPRGKVSPIKRPEYRKHLNITLAEWSLYHQNHVLRDQVTWMGIPVWKNVLDLHIYQEIIFEQRPDVIVEIGSAQGGSTLYFAHLCELLGNGIVISVDVDHEPFQARHDRIVCVTGASDEAHVREEVHRLAADKPALVIQDGDHSKEAVLNDLRHYADLIPPGGYFIVEDGIIDLFHPGNGIGRSFDGPMCAVEAFLQERPDFEIDASRERYLLTQNPKGYLRRKR